MAKSTPEEFADALYAAISWRRTELQALKSMLVELAPEDLERPRARMLLRSGIALLYAHWEGFSKQVLQDYLTYVARRRLKLGELRPELVATAMKSTLERSIKDRGALADLSRQIFTIADERARLPRSGVVETGSNLRYKRLVDILIALGLDTSDFETRQHLIDVRLCDARNEIAHGGFAVPDRDGVLELIGIVLQMMGDLLVQLTNAVAMKQYRALA